MSEAAVRDVATELGGISTEKLRRFVELDKRLKSIDEEGAKLKEEKTALELDLLGQFTESGIQRIHAGGRTVYLHRSMFLKRAEAVENDQVIAALKRARLGEFVKVGVNWQGLSSFHREREKSGAGLPPSLKGVVEPEEKFSLRTRKAG